MEKILLHLYQLRDKNYSQKEISETLKISQRNLSRKLKQWEFENILNYSIGNGRGNKTKIIWKRNIELEYYKNVLQTIENEDTESSIKYLNWSWSEDIKVQLLEKFNSLLGYKIEGRNKDKLVINKKYRLFTIHPLEATEAKSASIVNNVYDRLFYTDSKGNIFGSIAHYYEINNKFIDIYIRPNIRFQDGTTIDSDSIIHCLNKAKIHPNTSDMLKQINKILKINNNVVRIYFEKCPHILYILSHTTLSVYKEKRDVIIGSGPYKIIKNNEYTTILEINEYFYGIKPFIHTIELVYVYEDRYMFIGNRNNKHEFSEAITGFFYMCKNNNSRLNDKQLDYIKYILFKYYRYELNQHFKISLDDPFILKDSKYQLKEVSNPGFDNIVTIDCIVKNDIRYEVLKLILMNHNIPVKLNYYDYHIDINKQNSFKSDFLCFGEFIEYNEVFGYYNFIFNEQSIVNSFLKEYEWYDIKKKQYLNCDINDWNNMNMKFNIWLFNHNIIFPIYNNCYQLYYENGLMGIEVNEYGFLDLTKVWKK